MDAAQILKPFANEHIPADTEKLPQQNTHPRSSPCKMSTNPTRWDLVPCMY